MRVSAENRTIDASVIKSPVGYWPLKRSSCWAPARTARSVRRARRSTPTCARTDGGTDWFTLATWFPLSSLAVAYPTKGDVCNDPDSVHPDRLRRAGWRRRAGHERPRVAAALAGDDDRREGPRRVSTPCDRRDPAGPPRGRRRRNRHDVAQLRAAGRAACTEPERLGAGGTIEP